MTSQKLHNFCERVWVNEDLTPDEDVLLQMILFYQLKFDELSDDQKIVVIQLKERFQGYGYEERRNP